MPSGIYIRIKPNYRKGKTNEEIFGKAKAQEISLKLAQDNSYNKMERLLISYINITARGIISLFIMIFVLLGIRYIFPNFPTWYFLPIAFVVSIALTPLMSRIKIGHLFVEKYMQLLNNIVYKLKKSD